MSLDFYEIHYQQILITLVKAFIHSNDGKYNLLAYCNKLIINRSHDISDQVWLDVLKRLRIIQQQARNIFGGILINKMLFSSNIFYHKSFPV